MYDTGKIVIGIIVFLAIFSIPFVYSQVSGDADEVPDLEPALESLTSQGLQCVEDVDYMRAKHMDLLVNWRDEVVRGADREYVSENSGEIFDKSLTDTCLEQCHTNKSDFCDQCHTYVNVQPGCWECHNVWPQQPEEGE